MRDKRATGLLALGILLSLLTGWALYNATQSTTPGSAVAALQTQSVLVAKSDIPARTVVTAALLDSREYPVNLIAAGAMTAQADAIGQTTQVAIPAGAAVLRAQLVAAEGATGASLTVEPGKVLVVFPTADPLTAAGLVNEGDRIDLLATVSPTAETRATQTTLQNLTVLQVLRPTKELPQAVTALVFQVDPQVALVLKYLKDSGTAVDVAVRARATTALNKTSTVDLAYLLSTYGIKK
ncbi:MAG: Flp pilus assembly protein CpaB [Chloroflexota bacterium]|nr:Flp pilus assembly protein CpaB [Chloroflexota bacterium]